MLFEDLKVRLINCHKNNSDLKIDEEIIDLIENIERLIDSVEFSANNAVDYYGDFIDIKEKLKEVIG